MKIVFTVATGNPRYVEQALGLARSLALVGDQTRRVVLSDSDDPRLRRWFSSVVRPRDDGLPYLHKVQALDLTDADEVLFLDSDCLAFGRLDRIWKASEGAGMAVQGNWIWDGHWYGWLEELLPRWGLTRLPMFDGGMMYYRRCPETLATLAEVRRIAAEYDSMGLERFRGTIPDEPCVSIAMQRTGNCRLLPDNSAFIKSPTGVVGKLDVDVRRRRCRYVRHTRHGLTIVEPTILHAAKYVNNGIYWRQLSYLEKFERYEDAHPFGYMSPLHKLRRSMERRILKFAGKL